MLKNAWVRFFNIIQINLFYYNFGIVTNFILIEKFRNERPISKFSLAITQEEKNETKFLQVKMINHKQWV